MMRALFLSDLHIGSRRFCADALVQFMRLVDKDVPLYLIGDIFDDLGPRKWPNGHARSVDRLLNQERVIFMPGNHDAPLRNLVGVVGRNIEVGHEAIYKAASGKRYLVTHGDCFDPSLKWARGPRWLRRMFEGAADRWHSADYAHYIEDQITEAVEHRGFDGVICGHTHKPAHYWVDRIGSRQIEYVNCGDWIRHCTAAIDDGDAIWIVGANWSNWEYGDHVS